MISGCITPNESTMTARNVSADSVPCIERRHPTGKMPRSVEGSIAIPATCPKRLPRIQSMKAACQCELHTPLQKHTLTNLVSEGYAHALCP